LFFGFTDGVEEGVLPGVDDEEGGEERGGHRHAQAQ